MSAAGPSNYTFLQITKPSRGTSVRLEGKILGFEYFESVYSPMITASMVQADVGGSVTDARTGLRGTLKDALPIEGFEEVAFNITTRYGELNFTKDPMIVTGSPMNVDDSQKQSVLIPMVSKYSIDSSKKPLEKVYQESRISDIIDKILDSLKVPKNKRNIEKTSNVDKVSGNHEPPLDVCLELCKKSIPETGKDPGYFFFETQDGFQFRSIEGLINEGIDRFSNTGYEDTHTYNYFGALDANLDNDENNFKVLLPPVVKRDQNQLNALKHGLYNVRVSTMNTLTGEYREKVENLLSSSNLGDKQKSPVDSKNFSKSYSYIINPGADEQGVSEEVLNSPSKYEPRAHMRYGLLHSQLVDIQIPCNVQLRAGEVIKLKLENITQDEKLLSIYNQHRSGYYLILHLCHHFDPANSYTSLTLARDTYGLYTSKK